MDAGDDAAEGVARCGRCGRHWSQSSEICPLDGAHLTLEDTHDQPTVLLSRSMVADVRAAKPLYEHDDTATDVSSLDGARDVGGTTSMIPSVAAGPISSAEITAQTTRNVESEPPPTAQPASEPTTATRLDPGFVHLVPGSLVGEYIVERLLGSGGMGAVYGARHERLGRRAAIKVIAPSLSVNADAIERFEQEAQALALLSHPNIVDVLSVGTLPGDGRSYFVMAWLDGEPLQARLARGHFSLDDALDVLDQIARGLGAAHAAGIIHRDLKPDNIMLQRVGTELRPLVRLVDLGLAKLAEHRRTENTATNVMFGTAAYMSPEQCRSSRDVGTETDVYALGCVAFEMLCGRLPFTHDNVAELVVAHQAEESPRPRQLAPHLDPVLDSLLFAMLSKDPRRRPTVEQVRATLSLAASAARVEESRSGLPSVASTPPRIRRSRVMLGAGVASLLIVAVALTARGRTEDQRIEQRIDGIRLDGGMENHRAAAPLDAPAPVVVSAPAIDASVAAPQTVTGSGTATNRRKPRSSPEDAAIAADDDAAPSVPTSVDVGQPETPDSATEADRIDPSTRHHQAPPRENESSKVPNKKRTALERSPNRDQTFNPFEGKP